MMRTGWSISPPLAASLHRLSGGEPIRPLPLPRPRHDQAWAGCLRPRFAARAWRTAPKWGFFGGRNPPWYSSSKRRCHRGGRQADKSDRFGLIVASCAQERALIALTALAAVPVETR